MTKHNQNIWTNRMAVITATIAVFACGADTQDMMMFIASKIFGIGMLLVTFLLGSWEAGK